MEWKALFHRTPHCRPTIKETDSIYIWIKVVEGEHQPGFRRLAAPGYLSPAASLSSSLFTLEKAL